MENRSTDAKGRIREPITTDEDEVRFPEESAEPLSDRDRDLLLEWLANPPMANEALKRAARKYAGPHGRSAD